MYRYTVYHGTAAICSSIELYEIAQLRSGDGVALTLIVVGLTLRGGPLIRSMLYKKKITSFFIIAKNLLRRLFANYIEYGMQSVNSSRKYAVFLCTHGAAFFYVLQYFNTKHQ